MILFTDSYGRESKVGVMKGKFDKKCWFVFPINTTLDDLFVQKKKYIAMLNVNR